MSGRETHDDFERELTAGLERLAPPPRRDTVHRTLRAVAETPQRSGWSAGLSRFGALIEWPRVVAVGAVAVVALVVGIAIGTSGLLPSAEGPSLTSQPSATPIAVTWVEPADYQFVLESNCGLHSVLGTFAVTVENHEVTGFRTIAAQPARRDVSVEELPTVGELVRRAEELQATSEADVTLVLDLVDGYPATVRFMWEEDTTRNECYEISELSASSAPSASPPPQVADTFSEWTRIALPFTPDVSSGASASSLTTFKDGYLAVGTVVPSCCAGGDPSEHAGLIWAGRTPDSWTGGLLVFDHASFSKILAFDDQLLIVGSYAEPGSDPAHPGPAAIWRTTDGTGLNWERIDGPVPSIVAVGPDGFAGVRIDRTGPEEKGRSTFVTSVDGRTWTEISEQFPLEVVAMGVRDDGTILALANKDGEPWADGTPSQDVVTYLMSPSGEWHVAEPAVERGSMFTLNVADGRFYASGYREVETGAGAFARVDFVPTLWSSTSGTDWSAAPPLPDAIGYLAGVVDVGGTLLTVGDGLWVSEDGVKWQRIPDQQSLRGLTGVSGIIELPDGALAVGSVWNEDAFNFLPVALVGKR